MYIVPLLAQALEFQSEAHTRLHLGDRSTYIGLSDVAKALDCQRAAVANKLGVPSDSQGNMTESASLSRLLRLQRGHWFENGVRNALSACNAVYLPQLAIHTEHDGAPIIAHLDFVFPTPAHAGSKAAVQVLEFKSCERLPDTAYSSYEIQLAGQMSLLRKLWHKPCFTLGHNIGEPIPFPELVLDRLGMQLPDMADRVSVEGSILCMSMSDVREFGPYQPNETMLDICLNLAATLWSQAKAVRSGEVDLYELPTAKGFNPLCDWCEWNADCPRFAGISMPDLEEEIHDLQQLKKLKKDVCSRIGELESLLKSVCSAQYDPSSWISAETKRIRLSTCNGRRMLDADQLFTELCRHLDAEAAEHVIERSHRTTEPYERLMVSPINR